MSQYIVWNETGHLDNLNGSLDEDGGLSLYNIKLYRCYSESINKKKRNYDILFMFLK